MEAVGIPCRNKCVCYKMSANYRKRPIFSVMDNAQMPANHISMKKGQSSSLPWSQPREIIFKHTTQQKLGTLQEFIIEDEYPAL